MPRSEPQPEFGQLSGPPDLVPDTFPVLKDLAQGVRRDDDDLVRLEVMAQLAGRHEDGVQHFLRLRVAFLGVPEYLTDKVHRLLHLEVRVPPLPSPL